MIYKNILVPYDKSIHATHALSHALRQVADDPEAQVTVLYVIEGNTGEDATFAVAARMAGIQSVGTGGVGSLDKEYRDRTCAEIKAAVADVVAGAPNRIEYTVATGRPHHAILNYAYDHGCDLIVMGCRGLNALQGMMGSVSYAVVRASSVPVLVIK